VNTHSTFYANQLNSGDFNDFPKREVSTASAWRSVPQSSTVVAMPRSTCHLGIGARSSVHGLRSRGGRERSELLVTTARLYPGDS